MNTETKVKDTITEDPKRIKIGKFYFDCKPLNLSQVIEISELIQNNVKIEENNLETNMISFALNNPTTAKAMQEACLACVLPSKFKRRIFGSYVRKNLHSEEYKAIFKHITEAFDYGFFLGSLIFLKNTTTKTKREEVMTQETHIGA
jgi:hypothetical protein